MDSFEFWLRRMESKLERNARRPTTREDADDLWEITKVGLLALFDKIWGYCSNYNLGKTSILKPLAKMLMTFGK